MVVPGPGERGMSLGAATQLAGTAALPPSHFALPLSRPYASRQTAGTPPRSAPRNSTPPLSCPLSRGNRPVGFDSTSHSCAHVANATAEQLHSKFANRIARNTECIEMHISLTVPAKPFPSLRGTPPASDSSILQSCRPRPDPLPLPGLDSSCVERLGFLLAPTTSIPLPH